MSLKDWKLVFNIPYENVIWERKDKSYSKSSTVQIRKDSWDGMYTVITTLDNVGATLGRFKTYVTAEKFAKKYMSVRNDKNISWEYRWKVGPKKYVEKTQPRKYLKAFDNMYGDITF